jgi:hypothetical protein
MEPTTLLPVISLLLLVSVEYGGWEERKTREMMDKERES